MSTCAWGKWRIGDGQRADVIVVAVRDGDGIHLFAFDQFKARQPAAPLDARVRAGIHQQPMPFEVHEPGAGANGGVRIQVRDLHGGDPGGMTNDE